MAHYFPIRIGQEKGEQTPNGRHDLGIALTTLVLELISLCNIHCLDPFWTQRWFSYIFVYSFHDGYTWMTHPMSICE